jgi:hypothetical protein
MGLTGDALELAAGQETLERMVTFPMILIILFTILYFWIKKKSATDPAMNQAPKMNIG